MEASVTQNNLSKSTNIAILNGSTKIIAALGCLDELAVHAKYPACFIGQLSSVSKTNSSSSFSSNNN